MEKSISDLCVGDTLVVINPWSNKQTLRNETIVSIGRKWINLTGEIKVDKDTLKGERNTAYLSHEHYQETLSLSRMRQRAAKAIPEASDEQIKQIAAILSINGLANTRVKA